MRRRLWLAGSLMLLGAIGGAGLWPYPLVLRSRTGALPTGPDSFAHDGYVSIPAGLPVTGLAIVGLVLLLLPGSRKDAV
jgi:hypothetical protein